jgi:hypothetical protein
MEIYVARGIPALRKNNVETATLVAGKTVPTAFGIWNAYGQQVLCLSPVAFAVPSALHRNVWCAGTSMGGALAPLVLERGQPLAGEANGPGPAVQHADGSLTVPGHPSADRRRRVAAGDVRRALGLHGAGDLQMLATAISTAA